VSSFAAGLHLVLRHDNVLGRDEDTIHASVTQVDLHDFCRLSRTYGLAGFHCVTAMPAQHRICQEILDFWREGYGKDYNPDRVQALTALHLHHDFEQLVAAVTARAGRPPWVIGTSARRLDKTLDFAELSSIMERSERPALVQFGTSWGLAPEQLNRCDWVLPPIDGQDGYNHLSVRCAAAIITDRLFQSRCIDTPGDS
jgi:hypothetical protein